MASEEFDIIRHLLDVEREASETLLDAQKKADGIVSDARTEADLRFRNAYSQKVSQIDEKEKSLKEEILSSSVRDMENFKNNLSSAQKNPDEFNSLVEKLIFA